MLCVVTVGDRAFGFPLRIRRRRRTWVVCSVAFGMRRWWCQSWFCGPHPRNRRCYLVALSLICAWFLILICERHLIFTENPQSIPPDRANKRDQIFENKLAGMKVGGVVESVLSPIGDQVVNNGRVPKQVMDSGFHSTTVGATTSSAIATITAETATSTESVPTHTTLSEPATVAITLPGVVDALPILVRLGSPENMQKFMLEHNSDPPIYNRDRFPPLGANDVVLVVQVHKREKYLKLLLESLKAAKGIERVLLVISHDFYYDDVNKLVKSVDFCKVFQLFYPLSLQVVPNHFPGSSKEDCPRDASRQKAMNMNCTNSLHPDTYGHYREAIVTAIKHHWWWKLNTVFDNLSVTKNFSGYVFFLEEDHYVAPDFLEVAKQLIQLRQEKCQDCDFINLGMYTTLRSFDNHVSRGFWNAGKNNMGFGMNRATWNNIKNCSKHFCAYDDYNWDWSLNQLGKVCPLINRDLKVLVIKSARIFHIGTCGTHHHKSCNELRDANIVRDKIKKHSSGLFPKTLVLDGGTFPALSRRKLKPYGGWGDIRDHELCLKMARGKYPT